MVPASSLSKNSLRDWLESADTEVSVIGAILLDLYETDVFEWEPETLRVSLQEDLRVRWNRLLADKIMAFQLTFTTDQFFTSPTAFAVLCRPFNNESASFMSPEIPDTGQMVWAVTETALLLGEDYSAQTFNDDVARFVGAALQQDGIYTPPPTLKFAILPERYPEGVPQSPETLPERSMRHEAAYREAERYVAVKLKSLSEHLMAVPISQRSEQAESVLSRLGQIAATK